MAEIEQAALRLLAIREHTRSELRRKLQRKFSLQEIEPALDQLAGQNLQSDELYTEQYVRMRRGKVDGPVRIQADLLDKGVSELLIAVYIDRHDPEWRALARKAAEQKFGASRAAEFREKSRRGRFLEQRGFSMDVIWDYVNGL